MTGSSTTSQKSAALASPLSETDFDALMRAFPLGDAPPHLAVAVSGGPDSVALTMLLNDWVKRRNGKLEAFTVDHQLRVDSRKEAEDVGTELAKHNIPHTILTWRHHTLPKSAIHVRARAARYDLLFNACRAANIRHLFLAHHADDQAETLLIRFARGSALDGLAGMPSIREADGIEIMRPLLPIRKSRLVAACKENTWPFVTDPSNDSQTFTRGRLREAQDILVKEGLTTERLYALARATGLQRAHLEETANQFLHVHGDADAYGVIRFSYAAWRDANPDMQLRILTRTLLAASGEDYAPRSESLDHLQANLLSPHYRDQTLSYCRIQKDDETVTILREETFVQDAQSFKTPALYMRWDNRFVISYSEKAATEGLHVRKLGAVSRERLENMGHKELAALPALARATLPGLYKDQDLVDVPAFLPHLPENTRAAAHFLPRRSLIVKPFRACPPLQD